MVQVVPSLSPLPPLPSQTIFQAGCTLLLAMVDSVHPWVLLLPAQRFTTEEQHNSDELINKPSIFQAGKRQRSLSVVIPAVKH